MPRCSPRLGHDIRIRIGALLAGLCTIRFTQQSRGPILPSHAAPVRSWVLGPADGVVAPFVLPLIFNNSTAAALFKLGLEEIWHASHI